MSRYYCPQYCDDRGGWQDLPKLASKKEHEAIRAMEGVTPAYLRENTGLVLRGHLPAMRVWRKPHGWEPPKG